MKFLGSVFTVAKWMLLLLLLAAAAAYAASTLNLKTLDDSAREQLGGEYLQTSQGVLSYARSGPSNGPVVVLVHGFSTPKFVWEKVMGDLTSAGYQVIIYDHFGRGFSDRPDVTYNAALYRTELDDLITGLNLPLPIRLVGYSMGGANVVDYAAEQPEKIKQLVLIAPAGYMRNSASFSVLDVPVLGNFIASVFAKGYARDGIATEVEAGKADSAMLGKFDLQASYGGYTDSLLSTLLNYPMADLADRYQLIGATNIPVTAIWGTDDKIVPYSGAKLMLDDVNQLQLITLEGANHNMTYANDEVGPALVEALNRVE